MYVFHGVPIPKSQADELDGRSLSVAYAVNEFEKGALKQGLVEVVRGDAIIQMLHES